MKRIVALIGCALFAICFTSTAVMAVENRIGYVDLQKALNLSKAGQSAKEKIGEKVKDYEGIINSREEELKQAKEELEKKALLLSEAARSEKERDYQQKVKEFQRFTKDVQEELQQRDADMTRHILEELFEVIKKIGQSEGYALILEKTESSILYADSQINLTDKVIEAYDSQFEKTKAE